VPINPNLPGTYYPDVTSSPAELAYVPIYNPHALAVTARLTVTWEGGAGLSRDYVVPPSTRIDVDLGAQPGIGGTGPFSLAVQSLDVERPLVAEHSAYSAGWAAGRNDLGASPAPTWYFGEGVANTFFDETITVLNPTNGPVYVILDAIMPSGAPIRITKTINEGPGRWTLNMNSHAGNIGDHGLIVSAFVPNTQTPANIVVQRTLRWPGTGTPVESSTSSGTSTLTNNWYFGEGGKGAWYNYLAFMNPSATTTAAAVVWYVHDNGQTYTQNVDIPPLRRVTVSPPAAMPDGGFAVHVGSYNLVNYVVERSMYSGAGFALGHASTASPVQAYTWRFAEGVSNAYFDTFFLVFNPSFSSASTVTLTFRKVGGVVATQALTVQPRTRAVVYANGISGIANNATYATEVATTNGVAIVVERSMFWPQGAWAGSHVSLGRPQ
jgi:hypothetical protein